MRFRRATAAVSPLYLLWGHSSLWFHPQFLGGSEFALVHVEREEFSRAQVQGRHPSSPSNSAARMTAMPG
jgi:hypothetical protein